jgi:hypothetical protein
MLVLVSCCEQHDIRFANCEQDDAAATTEGNDQFAKLPVLFASAASVGRKRENPESALHRVAKPEKAQVIGRMACKLALNYMFLEAL